MTSTHRQKIHQILGIDDHAKTPEYIANVYNEFRQMSIRMHARSTLSIAEIPHIIYAANLKNSKAWDEYVNAQKQALEEAEKSDKKRTKVA